MSPPKGTDILVDKDELAQLYKDQAELWSIRKTIMDSELYTFMPRVNKGSLSDRIVGIINMQEYYPAQINHLTALLNANK